MELSVYGSLASSASVRHARNRHICWRTAMTPIINLVNHGHNVIKFGIETFGAQIIDYRYF